MNAMSVPVLVMAGVMVYVGSYHALIYLRQRQQREHLTFALSCLAMALYNLFTAGLYNVTSATEGVYWQRWQVVALALVAIAFAWFVFDYLTPTSAVPATTKRVLTVFSIYFALAAVTGMVDRSGLYRPMDQPAVKEIPFFGSTITYYEMDPGPLTNVQSVAGLVGFVYLLWITVRVYRSGYRQQTRPLLLAMGLFFASAVNDTAVVLRLYPFIYTLEYAYLGMVLVMTYALTSTVVEAAATKHALQISEARTWALLHAIPDMIFEIASDGTYLSFVPAPGLAPVMPPDQFLGKKVQETMPQPVAHEAMQAIKQALHTGQVQTFEYQLPTVEGTRDYEARTVASGENATLILVRDITKRKRAENALRESEERFRRLAENAPDVIFRWSMERGLEYISPIVSEATGYTAEELMVNPLLGFEIATGKDPQIVADYERVIAQGTAMPAREVPYVRKDGSLAYLDVRSALVKDDKGNVVAFEGILRDITERKLAQTERERLLADLMYRGTQLVAAAEVSKSAITILDPEELISQTVNQIQQRFDFYYVGLFLVNEAGKYAVLHAGSGEPGRKMLEAGHRLAAGGRSMIGQCVAQAEARIALDVGQEAVRFNNPLLPETRSEMALPLISRGECIGALTVQSNKEAAFSPGDVAILQMMADQLAIAITNARLYDEIQRYATQLEERVDERTAELAAVNKELEAFAYSVSHDLRAPLRSMDGFSQALLEDYVGQLDATGQDYLRRVRAASQRMGQLIDDLLKLSRLTRGELWRETVNLSALAQEIATELHRAQPERQVEFVITEGVVAHGDADLLRVVLENLLGNALKFTSKQTCAKIEFGYTEGEGAPVYFVRDNGAGFDMAYADKLFGAFQRLHRVDEFEGSGIGLATVQRIIHRHGGRVWAEGAVDKGATFCFTLTAKGEVMA